jgi:hypothetical protein
MVYFIKGTLPWQGLQGKNKEVKYDKIKEKKIRTTIEELTRGLPDELYQFLNYCRSIKFEEKPNYQFCRELFRGLMAKKGWEHDGQYDWILKKQGKALPKESAPQDIRQQQNKLPEDRKENRLVQNGRAAIGSAPNKAIQTAAEEAKHKPL